MAEETYDAIIVGGGFGGIYHLIHLREAGLKCKLLEAESALGGAWYWNTYPGARTDSEIPIYEFSRPELWKGWTWKERFPGWQELQAYFAYVDNKLHLCKDCRFNSRVTQAHWDDQSHIWHVTADGKDGVYNAAARNLIMCMGFASKPSIPKLKGLETFQGTWSHTARWPKEGIETNGKRVGIIGTGASGVQAIQAIGRDVEYLTIFQRTPNLAIPMGQYRVSEEVQDHFKPIYEEIYRKLPNTSCGTLYDRIPRPMMQDSEEERQATFRASWKRGAIQFWLGNYEDLLRDEHSNNAAYAFWRTKVIERVKDPKKRELLAPAVPPHPFGCGKRPCQEENFYEVVSQDNVDIVDVNANPILEITPKGVKTVDKEHELDVLVFATGFATHAGAFLDLDIRGLNGKTIQDHWRDGSITYLGMTIDNFPNLYFAHGPQSPMPSNAPTCIEVQGSWIVQTIKYLRQHGITKFTPTSHAALNYMSHIDVFFDATLFSLANKAVPNGGNIHGKKRQERGYLGGLSVYKLEIMEEIERGYPGFQREALRVASL